jgi:glycosyltransferase involved in cell wall biosynthesis
MVTVDVLIPCYNYGRYLHACVSSVLSQIGVSVRVLVIDDSSSDDTATIGRELAACDSRVEFRRHERNIGHIATYNEGLLGWSTGEYVVLLSADDMLAPGSLDRATSIMESDKTLGMVYGRAIHFTDPRELPRVTAERFSYSRFLGYEWLEGRCRAGHNVITSPEVVVRGCVQRAVGGYRSELPHSGDLEMWLRIAAVSNIAYVRGVPQAFYRVHQKSMMRSVYNSAFVDLQQRQAAFDSFFRHRPPYLADAGRLQDLANRALAREALWRACRAYDHNRVDEFRVDDLVQFAVMAYNETTSLPEYAGLRRRQRLGPLLCNRTQLFAPTAAIRRTQTWIRQQLWKRRGI